MTGLLSQGAGGCDTLTTVSQLPHSWGEEHYVDVSGQCSAQGRLKPRRLVVLRTCTALLMSNPPDLTGRVAWLQLRLSLGKWILVINGLKVIVVLLKTR